MLKGFLSLSIAIGHETGLFKFMCGTDLPATIEAIADQTNLKERYIFVALFQKLELFKSEFKFRRYEPNSTLECYNLIVLVSWLVGCLVGHFIEYLVI